MLWESLVPGIMGHAGTGGLLFYSLLSRSQIGRLSVLKGNDQFSSLAMQNLTNGLENEALRLCLSKMEIQIPIASRIKLLPKLVLQSVSFQFQTYMMFFSIPRNSSFTNNFIFLSIFWDLTVLCMCPLHFVILQKQSLRHGFMHQWFTGKVNLE